ncbi:cytidine deaminase [Dongia sp.]|jgi:cytidine deaminase|uniref:cytidine deaminase n=1 Tax=Dongia sp. TaxID=1977262 RepID=UPI0035B25FCC
MAGRQSNGDRILPPLSSADQELLAAATDFIRSRYAENRHHIGAAVRGASGRIYLGLHLDTYVGRCSVCAEAVALGSALSAGETAIDAIVSVRHPRPKELHAEPKVVSPCGICREMLTDFAPGSDVIMTRDGELARVPAADLLPEKYRRAP